FFQAEDGIRDKLVTGVQTCALPISEKSGAIGFVLNLRVDGRGFRPCQDMRHPYGRFAWRARAPMRDQYAGFRTLGFDEHLRECRSEERRVGKECRSRWAGCD